MVQGRDTAGPTSLSGRLGQVVTVVIAALATVVTAALAAPPKLLAARSTSPDKDWGVAAHQGRVRVCVLPLMTPGQPAAGGLAAESWETTAALRQTCLTLKVRCCRLLPMQQLLTTEGANNRLFVCTAHQ